MKILYVTSTGVSGLIFALPVWSGHEVTYVTASSEALEIIRTGYFDAVLIAEEIEDSEAIEFISGVHRAQPELLVFQLSVWRSDLAETLERLEPSRSRKAAIPLDMRGMMEPRRFEF